LSRGNDALFGAAAEAKSVARVRINGSWHKCAMSSEIDEPNDVAGRLRSMWFAGVAEIAGIDLEPRKWLESD
jgi:hypothetical protein